jgi:hypothetical protein
MSMELDRRRVSTGARQLDGPLELGRRQRRGPEKAQNRHKTLNPFLDNRSITVCGGAQWKMRIRIGHSQAKMDTFLLLCTV